MVLFDLLIHFSTFQSLSELNQFLCWIKSTELDFWNRNNFGICLIKGLKIVQLFGWFAGSDKFGLNLKCSGSVKWVLLGLCTVWSQISRNNLQSQKSSFISNCVIQCCHRRKAILIIFKVRMQKKTVTYFCANLIKYH